jgi:hypothetical protein
MKNIKEYKKREYTFSNVKKESSNVKIYINDEFIKVDFNSIIKSHFSCGNTGVDLEYYKSFLKLGIYSKSPCGGFVNFFQLYGSKGNKYIVFSGVNEISNSNYIVTIHKILQ